MEENQSSAQTETTQESQPQAQAETPANDGIQKRFDQLTAQIHEERRAKDELLKQVMEMAARQAAPAQAPAPAPVDPLASYTDKLDPIALEAVRAATAATQKQFQEEIARQQAQFAAQMSEMQIHTLAAQQQAKIPEEVRKEAVNIARKYGTAADVALKLAYGEFALKQHAKVAGVAGYQPPTTPVMTSAAPAPTQSASRRAPPADLDNLSPSEQLKWFEANGIDDQPF